MNVADPIPFWSEPEAVKEWGQMCTPPIAPAWLDYINFQLTPEQLTVFFRVIFPQFVVINNFILLKMNTDEFSAEAIINLSKQAVNINGFERKFNMLKIYELFSHAEDSSEKAFEMAALLLKRSWEITLKSTFPDKAFEVVISNADRDYGPTISFFQV